jgi:hypothetical protein
MTLRTTPRPSPCAGRAPGDRSGLSRARPDPAWDLHWEASPAASAAAIALPSTLPAHRPEPVVPSRPHSTARLRSLPRIQSP